MSDVLSAVFAKSLHRLCLAHVVNLAAEVFHQYSDFKHTSNMIAMIKSSLFKKPSRKSRYLKYLNGFIASSKVKLLPAPVSSHWKSWFETTMYQATRVRLYGGFYRAGEGVRVAVERIIELVSHKTIYPEITILLYFIKELAAADVCAHCSWWCVRPSIIWRISRCI